RAALHTSLRAFDASAPFYEEVNAERERMLAFADRIRSEGKITDVINIGIGGSEMGPHAVWHALQPLNPTINLHFLSTVDGTLLDRILSRCRPESTLAIVSSKSFGTRETMVNAEMVDAWFARAGITGERRHEHIVTVSSKEDAAESLGLRKENGFKIWPWVGGRFSVWSAIGLPLAIGLGRETFLSFLRGANAMDKHALNAPVSENLPILMALLAYWDATKLEIPSRCLVPYDCRLD
ncbi:glucose-6-phosphate isomerase, partial [Sutterella seckii]